MDKKEKKEREKKQNKTKTKKEKKKKRKKKPERQRYFVGSLFLSSFEDVKCREIPMQCTKNKWNREFPNNSGNDNNDKNIQAMQSQTMK